MGCHLVILACNTASAKALRSIQQKDLPLIAPEKRVLGVIRPTAEVVGKITSTKNIGVLGTKGTVNSDSYPIEIKKLFPDVHVFQEACPMWVPLVENLEHENEGADFFIKKNIHELLSQSKTIDTIILGCTHYPLLLNKINQHLPKHIRVLSQGEIVAESLADYLKRHPEIELRCSKKGTRSFYTTDSTETFDQAASVFFEENIRSQHLHLEQ